MLTLLFVIVMLSLYFIPTINAYLSKHRNAQAVFVLNLFLGWTGIGWIVALVWSAMK